MRNIAIYGAGGFGREVRGMLEVDSRYSFAGFFDDYLKLDEAVKAQSYDDVLFAVADPNIRMKLVQKWSGKLVPFKSLVSSDVQLHPSVAIGKGSIICPGVKATVHITIGDFVIINLNATIGHDAVIGNYCSLMPSVNISGSVTLGERVFVGTGATILQGITIGDDAVIGAGAVVTHDVAPGKTVMGIPAKEKTS